MEKSVDPSVHHKQRGSTSVTTSGLLTSPHPRMPGLWLLPCPPWEKCRLVYKPLSLPWNNLMALHRQASWDFLIQKVNTFSVLNHFNFFS